MNAEQLGSLREYCRDEAAFEALQQFLRDIQQQYQQSERLLASAQQESKAHSQQILFQASLLDQVSHAVVATDQQGRITYWNRQAECLYQWQASEATGKNIYALLVRENGQKLARKILARTLKSARWRGELLLQRKDGSQFWADVTNALLHDQSGQPMGFVGIAVDITERKQAQAMLEMQAETLQAQTQLLDLAGDAIVTYSLNGAITFWNRGATSLYGWKNIEALGQNIHMLLKTQFPRLPHARSLKQIKAHLQQHGRWEGELIHTTRDGTAIVVSSRWALQRDAHGRPLAILEINTDITQRKQAEAALKAAHDQLEATVAQRTEELAQANAALRAEIADRCQAEVAMLQAEVKYRSIFENAIEGIFQTTAEGRYLSANPALAQLYGYASPDDLIMTLTDVRHQLYVDPHRRDEFIRLVQLHGTVAKFESEVYRKDGQTIWVSENARAVYSADGHLLYYEGTTEDITDRKQREAERQQAAVALQQSEARYRAVVEDQTDMISRFLPDGTLTFVNDAYCRCYGKTRDELIGQNLLRLLPEDCREKVQQKIAALSRACPALTSDQRLVTAEGEVRWQQWTDRMIFDSQGNFVEFQATGRDITEQKKAEQALRQSEAENRALLDVIPDTLFRIRRDGSYLSLKADKTTDQSFPDNQLVGRNVRDHLPPDLARQRLECIERTLQTGATQTIEYQIVVNGVVREQESRMVVCGEDEVLAIDRDITERKRTETHRRQQSERDQLLGAIALRIRQSLNLEEILYRTVAEVRQFLSTDRVLIYQFDAANSGALVADSVAPAWDIPIENSLHQNWYRDGHAIYEHGKTAVVNDINQLDLAPDYREIMARLDVKAKLVVPIIQGQQLWGVLAVHHCADTRQWQQLEVDLLEQLATQVAIAIQQAQLFSQVQQQAQREKLLNQISQTLNSSLDADYILQEIANLAGEGFNVDRVLILTIGEEVQVRNEWRASDQVVSQLSFRLPLAEWPDLLDLKSTFHQRRFFHAPDYGQEPMTATRQLQIEQAQVRSVLACPILIRGQLFGSIALQTTTCYRTFTDEEIQLLQRIADQSAVAIANAQSFERLEHLVKERTQELEHEKRVSEAASRAKSEFLATMSHELRTPLNAILGLSQLLQQQIFGSLNSKQAEYVHHIHTSGDHLLLLINDILDLAKVESGRETLELVAIDALELCNSCLSLVREQSYDRDLQLISQFDPAVSVCTADERRLKQILINLLSNAIKFTPSGTVSLIVEKRPNGVAFTVADTGIGIPAEQIPLLFKPFSQLDSQLNRQYAGTGLGLALSRDLARLHGGDITVTSIAGAGSQFTLFLPDPETNPLEPSAVSSPSSDPHGFCAQVLQPRRILIVEDDHCSAILLRDYLQAVGHQVEHLIDDRQFLDVVSRWLPHLILLDVQLTSGRTGLDLLTELRSQPGLRHIPVVMVTAMAMAGDREKFIAAGANDYLSKPLTIAQLELLLMRCL